MNRSRIERRDELGKIVRQGRDAEVFPVVGPRPRPEISLRVSLAALGLSPLRHSVIKHAFAMIGVVGLLATPASRSLGSGKARWDMAMSAATAAYNMDR
jgi:hypothetical protein